MRSNSSALVQSLGSRATPLIFAIARFRLSDSVSAFFFWSKSSSLNFVGDRLEVRLLPLRDGLRDRPLCDPGDLLLSRRDSPFRLLGLPAERPLNDGDTLFSLEEGCDVDARVEPAALPLIEGLRDRS